ncbi:ATP-binding protein [Oceanospirillum sp.]|uniref:ATP-binding protein n=1 Tax=Oceanospirillum sp. TaxID=2021254 RepID=UPI003A8D1490
MTPTVQTDSNDGHSLLSSLGMLLLFIFIIWQVAAWTEHYELSQLESQARNELTLNIASLRGKLDKYEFLPEILVNKQNLAGVLREPKPDSIQQLNAILKNFKQITDVSDIYLLDEKGTTIAASNWQNPKSFIGQNFSYRPYYQQAINGQSGRFYGLGTTSGERGYYFSYPVFSGSSPIGVLVVKIVVKNLEIPWKDPRTEFIVTDPDGIIFITSRREWLLHSIHNLSNHDLERIHTSKRYGEQDIKPLAYRVAQTFDEGMLVKIASDRDTDNIQVNTYLQFNRAMPNAGWHLHILKNTQNVRTEILKNSLLAAGIYMVLVLLTLYSLQRQRIQRERVRHDRETKKALEANEARIRAILDNTKAGIITMDRAGKVDYINPTAEVLFGYQLHELHGHNFSDLINHHHKPHCQQALTEASSHPIEVQGLRKDRQPVPVEMIISMMGRSQGSDYMITLHDITERKQHEEALQAAYDEMENRVVERTQDLTETNDRLKQEIEQHRHTAETLQKTQDELIQAAKLAVLGQMSASINHELNQPLAAIRTYAENSVTFIQRDQPDMAQGNLEQIVELTDRMATISAQLKLFARKSEGQLAIVSVQATIQYALRLFRPQLEKEQIALNITLPDQDLFVRADAVRLEQVIVNLISNALLAVSGRREKLITVSLRQAQRDSNNLAIIDVADSGAGITSKNLRQIFTPFFSTREGGKGLGLGLSISYRIISDFGGSITAFNRPEGGATLRVTLPIAEAPEVNSRPSASLPEKNSYR